MVKLVVVLSGLHQGDHSLPMNYFSFPIFYLTKLVKDFFTNLLKFILNPTLFNKLINKKRGITPLLNFIFLNQVL